MSSTRAILFRFDRDPVVCRDRIRSYRRHNPGVKIYGLYGGPGGYRRLAFRAAGRQFLGLDHLFISPQAGRWNWKNSDLALAEWFRRVGHTVDFDVLHFLEWDILMLDSLARIYAHVPPDAVALTTLTPLEEVAHDWEWMATDAVRAEWEQLIQHARTAWDYDARPYVCLAGGACFPRSYVERFTNAAVPPLCHDELRLPLFAQAHGFSLVDTRLRTHWRDDAEDRFFNLTGTPVTVGTIRTELSQPAGRRVFHPVRTVWGAH